MSRRQTISKRSGFYGSFYRGRILRFLGVRSIAIIVLVSFLMTCNQVIGQDIWATYRQAAEARVAEWEASAPPGGTNITGVYMWDLRTSESFVDIRSGQLFITASNMKLFTGAFAMAKLGPSFEFKTQIYLLGNDIVVVGEGDATIGAPDLAATAGESVYAELDRWADAIKTQAAGQFTGDILLVSRFNLQGQYHHPGKGNPSNPVWYAAPIDALNFHDNYYDLTYTVSGGTVTPHLEPASSFIQVINNLTVGGSTNLSLSSTSDESTVTLNGTVTSSSSTPWSRSCNQPGMLLGRTLADRIVQAGVSFTGQIQMVDPNSLDLASAVLLYEKALPISEALKRMSKRSLNMAANCLFLRAGDGTWSGSQTMCIASMTNDYNLDPNGFNIIEGSGLFESTVAQPLVFVDLLTQMAVHPDGNMYRESLPVSGEDGTTLQQQGRYPEPQYNGRVLGKTGTVGSASCLSGYVLDGPGGQPVVAYSILNNKSGYWGNWYAAPRDMQDDIIKLLVDTLDSQVDQPPVITNWYSGADHARGIGEVLLEIPDDGSFCESRSGGIGKLVIKFNEALDPTTVTPSDVEIAGLDANNITIGLGGVVIDVSLRNGDTEVIVTFTPALPDYARYTVRISGVADLAANELTGDNDRVMTGLIGDVSGNLSVNVTDLSRVRTHRTGLINPGNSDEVRSDVSLDGRVNVIDLSRIRPHRGNDASGITDPVLGGG